jgi:hypothetical protein
MSKLQGLERPEELDKFKKIISLGIEPVTFVIYYLKLWWLQLNNLPV